MPKTGAAGHELADQLTALHAACADAGDRVTMVYEPEVYRSQVVTGV